MYVRYPFLNIVFWVVHATLATVALYLYSVTINIIMWTCFINTGSTLEIL